MYADHQIQCMHHYEGSWIKIVVNSFSWNWIEIESEVEFEKPFDCRKCRLEVLFVSGVGEYCDDVIVKHDSAENGVEWSREV